MRFNTIKWKDIFVGCGTVLTVYFIAYLANELWLQEDVTNLLPLVTVSIGVILIASIVAKKYYVAGGVAAGVALSIVAISALVIFLCSQGTCF
jgi:hypothetical protein